MNGKPFTRPFLCADMLRKAVGKVSHDVRTSMNAIVGSTDLMAHESDMSDKMHTHIKKEQMFNRYLLSFINDVPDMSKIESSIAVLKKDTVSLAELPCDETRSCRL